ncbi:hypothetical protein B0H19DRAFT_1082657 [Mycena capillaripes]|nr:hypothetical protein B0H19DRAFT_1082657 [Mycena capillaripes]
MDFNPTSGWFTEYRTIPPGDLDLLHEIPVTAAERKRTTARLYSCRVHGLYEDMTAHIYQGKEGEEKWQLDIGKFFSAGKVQTTFRLFTADFCYYFTRADIPGLEYTKAMQFVVRLEDDGNRLLFGELWDEWISSGQYLSQPHVILCVVRGDTCCDKPTETIEGFWRVKLIFIYTVPRQITALFLYSGNCGVQFLEDVPSGPDDDDSTPHTLDLVIQSYSEQEKENKGDHDIQPMPTPLQTELAGSATSSFEFSAKNSVVRRRKFLSQQEEGTYPPDQQTEAHFNRENDISEQTEPVSTLDTPVSGDHTYPPELPTPQSVGGDGATRAVIERLQQMMYNHLGNLYIFLVAPPWIYDEATVWDVENLGNRLDAFKSWVCGANAAVST